MVQSHDIDEYSAELKETLVDEAAQRGMDRAQVEYFIDNKGLYENDISLL